MVMGREIGLVLLLEQNNFRVVLLRIRQQRYKVNGGSTTCPIFYNSLVNFRSSLFMRSPFIGQLTLCTPLILGGGVQRLGGRVIILIL